MSILKPLNRLCSEGHLRKLPEMELFPSPEARERAVRELYEELGGAAFALTLLLHGVAITVVFVLLAKAIGALFPGLVPWSGHIALGVVVIGYVTFALVALRFGMIKDLRRKLVEAGVPVCMKCGYDLRGAPPAAPRCPECGAVVPGPPPEA